MYHPIFYAFKSYVLPFCQFIMFWAYAFLVVNVPQHLINSSELSQLIVQILIYLIAERIHGHANPDGGRKTNSRCRRLPHPNPAASHQSRGKIPQENPTEDQEQGKPQSYQYPTVQHQITFPFPASRSPPRKAEGKRKNTWTSSSAASKFWCRKISTTGSGWSRWRTPIRIL